MISVKPIKHIYMKKLYTLALGLLTALGVSAQVSVGDTNYETLQAAIDAAEAGATLTITSDVNLGSRVDLNKAVTIEAVNDAKIVLTSNLTSARILVNGAITFNNVTFDGGNFESDRNIFEVNTAGVVFNNLKLVNVKQNSGRSLQVKAKTQLVNFSYEDCSFTNGGNPVFVGQSNVLTVSGTGDYNVFIEKEFRMAAEDFTGNIGIELGNWSARTIVNNGNIDNFSLVNAPEGWFLTQNGTNLDLVKNIITNENTGVSYTSFADAYAEAAPNNVLVLLDDLTLGSRQDIKTPITIKGLNPEIKIIRNFTNNILFNPLSGGHLTLENLIIDSNNKANSKNGLEAGNANITLNNVKIINSVTTESLIGVKSSRTLTLNNVTVENCTGKISLANNGRLVLNGNNTLNTVSPSTNESSISVAQDGALTNESPIAIELGYVPTADNAGQIVVKNCKDAYRFSLISNSWHLEADGDNLVLVAGDTTGIEAVVTEENAPVEYYNLQGMRVENPTTGIYIRRQGTKA